MSKEVWRVSVSWAVAARILLIALAIGMASAGLKGLALTPAFWLHPYVIGACVALGAFAIPKDHWLRASVGAFTLAAIQVLAALARTAFSSRMPPPVDLETRGFIVLGFGIVYALPFCWWLWYSKRHAS
jgi:hypothetical protein